MQRTPDQYDIKAARVHGTMREDEDAEDGESAAVVIVGLQLPFGDVVKLCLQFIVVQSAVAGFVILVLAVIGVL